MNRYLPAVALCLIFSVAARSQTAGERRDKIQALERKEPSKEASERKARSVARLR